MGIRAFEADTKVRKLTGIGASCRLQSGEGGRTPSHSHFGYDALRRGNKDQKRIASRDSASIKQDKPKSLQIITN